MRCSHRRHALALPLAAASLCASALAPHARAEIRIIKANGDPVPVTAYTIAFNRKSGGIDVTLTERYNPGLESVFDIRANAGEYISNVFINVDGPSAGSPIIVKVQGEAPAFLSNVGNIVQNGTGETILTRVQTTQDVGSITVEVVGDIIAGRDVLGPITSTTADNTVRGITSVQATRDILGDCTADNGRILLIWAQRHLGAQADPILIRAKHSVYQVMGDDVFADIHTRYNGGTGGFWALVCNRFGGTLSTEQLIFNPWNSLHARIAIYNEFDGLITIGKSYNNPNQYIELPPPPPPPFGFTGQVVVNADGAANGTWSAPVRIGPNGHANQIVLNSPGYSHSASQLGGGSIGLVPFRLHDEACVPANGSTVQVSPSDQPVTVELRHYGPVNFDASAVTVERRTAGTTGAFAPVSMSSFFVARAAADRSLTLTAAAGSPGFEPGWQYRIRPTADLFCDISTAPPALATPPNVVWDGDYLLTVTQPPCEGDISADGMVNVTDLLFVISFWGPASPSFPAADINGDGSVNVTDLLTVISKWGACW